MPFQESRFVREQNFTRDRDLGAPNDTISATKVDGEFDNVAVGLSQIKAAQDELDRALDETTGAFYPKAATDEKLVLKLDKAGGALTGPVTLGGKAGAAKGVVSGGTVVFDYLDGNVQTITVNGAVTFAFKDLPAAGGTLQVNLTIASGSITVEGTTWWELGGGEKSTAIGDIGMSLQTGRPYRMIVEMVGGFRAGIFQ